MNNFQAFEIAIQMVASLKEPLAAIAQRDSDLASQLRRAATSVPLNLAEGRRRVGKDRLHLFRIASGSADEVTACLRVAAALGYLPESDVTDALGLADRVRAIAWTLTR